MVRNADGWTHFARVIRNPDGSVTLTLMPDNLWTQLTNGLEYITSQLTGQGAEYVAVKTATDPFRPPGT